MKVDPKEISDPLFQQLIDDMFETMYAAPGVGLAAPQVNVSKRMFVMDIQDDEHEPAVVINPATRVDLLVARNTLMYFNAETQSNIIRKFHFALSNPGFLFLGKAEMLLNHGDQFEPVDLRKRLFAGAAGTLTWTWASGKSSIGYYVAGSDDWPIVNLHYRWRDKEDVHIPICLEATPTQFGGRRWWFICPLIVRGIACNRRAGKLYLPTGARYFGCRKCYDLTYRSCQQAHQMERLFRQLGL